MHGTHCQLPGLGRILSSSHNQFGHFKHLVAQASISRIVQMSLCHLRLGFLVSFGNCKLRFLLLLSKINLLLSRKRSQFFPAFNAQLHHRQSSLLPQFCRLLCHLHPPTCHSLAYAVIRCRPAAPLVSRCWPARDAGRCCCVVG
jgi:hypothetical protein